jgi:hypothetical protein
MNKNIRKLLQALPDEENPKDDGDSYNTEQSDREEENTNNESAQLHASNDDQTLSNVALFTPSICDRFDRDAKEYGQFLQKQSCR